MPRVEFTLSFEDYMSWYGRTPAAPRTKVVGKIAVTGLLLMCLGFLFAVESPESTLPTGALAISVGFCATMLCIPLWFIVEKRNPKADERVHRRLYEYYFSESRSLEFDEQSFTYSYGAARNSLPWTDLISFIEYGGVTVLGDRYVQYMIRSVALGDEIRKELKEHCKKGLGWQSGTPVVTVELNAFKYFQTQASRRWRCETRKMVSLYLIGLILASLIAFIFAGALSVHGWPIAAVLILLMPVSEMVTDRIKFRLYRSQHVYDEVVFSASSVCFRDKQRLWKLSSEWIVDLHETPREIRLYVTEETVYVFSKKDLGKEQIERLRELFAAGRRA